MLNVRVFKFAVQTLGSLGCAKVVSDIIKNNTVATNLVEKVLINSGSLVFGSLVMDLSTRHINEIWASVSTQIEEAKEEAEKEKKQSGPIEVKNPEENGS